MIIIFISVDTDLTEGILDSRCVLKENIYVYKLCHNNISELFRNKITVLQFQNLIQFPCLNNKNQPGNISHPGPILFSVSPAYNKAL